MMVYDEPDVEYFFPDRLEETMNERGFSPRDLEDLGVVSQSSVNAYLKGETIPNLRTAAKLAMFFGVSLDYLCGLGEDSFSRMVHSREIDRKAPWL